MSFNTKRETMGSRAGNIFVPATRKGQTGLAVNIPSVANTVNVSTANRPFTQVKPGITGIENKDAPTRKIYDRNYYITKLKEQYKVTLPQQNIVNQIDKITKKSQQTQKQQNIFIKMENRYQELAKQVRNLQGTLADYNLAFDKMRINTRPQDIKNAYMHVRQQNQQLKNQLDKIFLQRKKQQEELESKQNQLQQIHQMMELRLNQLDPVQRKQHDNLIKQNKMLINQIQNKRSQIQDVNNRIAQADSKLKMDSQKLKGHLLKQQIFELEEKKNNLQVHLNQANLSFPEARDLIQKKTKQDNNTVTQLTKRITEIKKTMDNFQKKIRDANNQLAVKKTQNQQKKQYEHLYQKDLQMEEFFNQFENLRKKELSQMTKAENSIIQLLEQNSKLLEITNQLPSRQIYNSVSQSAKGQTTITQIKFEYEMRLNNLKNMQMTEIRVNKEIEQLRQKIKQMKQQIRQKYDKVGDVENQIIKKKKELNNDYQNLNGLKPKCMQESNKIVYQYQLKTKKLKIHQMYSQYSELEEKLAQLQAHKYYLKNFIVTKSKDMQYQEIKKECLDLMQSINKNIIK